MVVVNVLTSAHLLPLVIAYQEGVNQDVRILTRLGHSPLALGGDLGPVHAVMAPWLDRAGFRFVPQLCPTLLLSYALEYGRVDLVRELMATNVLRLKNEHFWSIRVRTWVDCILKHRYLHQLDYWFEDDQNSHGPYGYEANDNISGIAGYLHELAAAACRGGHVDLLRFFKETFVDTHPLALVEVALRAGRLCIVQELLEQRVISVFTAHHVRLASTSGSVDLVAFLLNRCSHGMIAEAFEQATIQNQFALLQWLCTTYNEPRYRRIALSIAASNLQLDVIAYFASTHNLHLTPAEAARVHRRCKRLHDDDEPARQTRPCN